MSPSRVFIDSSVFFAAALSASGYARDLLAAPGHLELVVSRLVLEETGRNLASKAPRALASFELLVGGGTAGTVDEPPLALIKEVGQIVVLKDAPIVAAAIWARADTLASYDRKHLLRQAATIQDHFGIIVATPEIILARQ